MCLLQDDDVIKMFEEKISAMYVQLKNDADNQEWKVESWKQKLEKNFLREGADAVVFGTCLY